MNNEVVVKVGIFTVINGKVKLVLEDNDLIKSSVYNESLENVALKCASEYAKNIVLNQCCTNSIYLNNKYLYEVLYICIVSSDDILKKDNLFSVEEYNDKEVVKYFKYYINKIDNLKNIYSLGFTLSELHSLFEFVLDIKIDRRNFRKRLLKLGIIEDLNIYNSEVRGRPAKLYKFNEFIDLSELY